MSQLKKILWNRLEKKGLDKELIPGFINAMSNTLLDKPYTGSEEINRKLHLIGWDDFEVDDHTLQLIIAGMENDNFIEQEKQSSRIKKGLSQV